MLNDFFKRPRHSVQQSVERMLKQMFKQALTLIEWPLYNEELNNYQSECAR